VTAHRVNQCAASSLLIALAAFATVTFATVTFAIAAFVTVTFAIVTFAIVAFVTMTFAIVIFATVTFATTSAVTASFDTPFGKLIPDVLAVILAQAGTVDITQGDGFACSGINHFDLVCKRRSKGRNSDQRCKDQGAVGEGKCTHVSCFLIPNLWSSEYRRPAVNMRAFIGSRY
jgi:hypothetical protein